MLVSTMNDQELTKAVWLDMAAIYKSSTIPRLRLEYDRERRKKKIRPESRYPRCFSIRSKAKNTWLIFMEKAPIIPKYRNDGDIAFHCVVYYFGPKGFTVFKPDDEEDKTLFVYQGHVFTRYCQRMQLHLPNPLDKIRHFFSHNAYADHRFVDRKDRRFSMGICRDGVLLGDYRKDVNWVFNRTFVNRDIFYKYQERAELEVMTETSAWAQDVMSRKVPAELILKKANTAHAIFCGTS